MMKGSEVPGGEAAGRAGAWLGREDVRTFLDPGTSVTGKLSFTAPTRIEGQLKGEVRASGLLMIGASAQVEAEVQAKTLIIEGQLHGEVRGADRVEIKAGGCLMGSVETRILVVHEGGCLEGDCKMPQAAREAESVTSRAVERPGA